MILTTPSAQAALVADCKRNRQRKLTLDQARRLAHKWGVIRGIPPAWVLGTMLAESQLKPCLEGDWITLPNGSRFARSLGLMQVNTVANAALLAQLGLKREDMFDPDKNVAVGSYLLAQYRDKIQAALAAHPRPQTLPRLGVMVALAYKGYVKVVNAIRAGRDPSNVYGPAVLAHRSNALFQAEAMV